MALSHFSLQGKAVPYSDLVAVVSVVKAPDFTAFSLANKSRLCDDSMLALTKELARGEREATEEVPDCKVLLTFAEPPKHSRPQFVFGRDPKVCDVVLPAARLRNRQLFLDFDGDHLVMNDMSSNGCKVAIDDRAEQPTCPAPGKPYRFILPPGSQVKITLTSFTMVFQVFKLSGGALDLFRKNRDALLANTSDEFLTALDLHSQISTVADSSAATPRPKTPRAMYYFERILGKGGFGEVYAVRCLQDWTQYAAKEATRGDLEKEIEMLQKLRHENIVRFVDWYPETARHNILVMEHCHFGSLHQVLKTERLDPREMVAVLHQAAKGLAYLHGENVTHRDLKPANILLRERHPLSVAISDFGLAKDDDSWMVSECGTAEYLAPEMSDVDSGGYDKAVDIWALGVVGIEMLEGQLPQFRKAGWGRYPRWMSDKADELVTSRQERCGSDWQTLLLRSIAAMLSWEAEDRPDAATCVAELEALIIPSSSTASPSTGNRVGGGDDQGALGDNAGAPTAVAAADAGDSGAASPAAVNNSDAAVADATDAADAVDAADDSDRTIRKAKSHSNAHRSTARTTEQRTIRRKRKVVSRRQSKSTKQQPLTR